MQAFDASKGQTIKGGRGYDSCDQAFIAHYHIAAADATAAGAAVIKAAVTLADGATTTVLAAALTAQPKVPRVLSITGNAASAVGDVVVTGKDAAGQTITETIISTGAATVAGIKSFKSIDSIVFPARGAGGDTISVGITDDFGVPFLLPYDTTLKIMNNKTATTVASSSFSETELCKNFLNPTAALAGADIDVYLMV